MAGQPRVALHADPRAFLQAAQDYLAASPVVVSVVTSAAHAAAGRVERGEDPGAGLPAFWYATVHDDAAAGAVVGVAMRTATFVPQPVYVLPMPDDAATVLARAITERDEPVDAVYGASPAAERVLEACTGLTPDDTRVERERLRLHELSPGALRVPSGVPGRLRQPRHDELTLVVEWWNAFMREADEQAGRPPGATPAVKVTPEEIGERVAEGEVWVWADSEGTDSTDATPVHVLGRRGPHLGVGRIGPVYTPPQLRGRGYAAAAVAEVSKQLLDAGARVCLFTDLANPTSNALYERLGYVGVVDFVQLRVG